MPRYLPGARGGEALDGEGGAGSLDACVPGTSLSRPVPYGVERWAWSVQRAARAEQLYTAVPHRRRTQLC